MPANLTKYTSGKVLVTEKSLNSFYGGQHGKDGEDENPQHPLVAGHIHDGLHKDGHAQKINLADDVTGSLEPESIANNSIPLGKIDLDILKKGISLLILDSDGNIIVDEDGSIVTLEIETEFNYIITDIEGNLISDNNGNIVIKEI